MKLQITIKDEQGFQKEYTITRSEDGEPSNLNDFILKALTISEDKRKLPFFIQSPNGIEVFPSIKMKFENYGSPLLGDKIEAMVVSHE